jgi:hypothetical protein
LVQSLKDTENISYLPKSIFKLLSHLVEKGILSSIVIINLEEFIKKFLFHNNEKVLLEVYGFITKFFKAIKENKLKVKT